jgi:hypothetical protein
MWQRCGRRRPTVNIALKRGANENTLAARAGPRCHTTAFRMSAAQSVSAAARVDRRPWPWPLAIPAVVAFAYACGHLQWYLGTPLGQVPMLDERENLAFAEAIFHGALPAEPFYRAPGYALGLAGLRALGVPAGNLFAAALALGVLLHALNAALVARLARRWFADDRVALAAGLIGALHPVFVHFATQALDATPALTCFLLGLNFLPAAPPSGRRGWAAASVAWAAATVLRPNYLLVWLALPALAAASAWPLRAGARDLLRPTGTALSGALLFLAVAAWQWQVSGVAGFLPWQGAYNLWAANQPGAHGRYYVQHVSLPDVLARENPARVESALLYQRETGLPPADIAAMNAHWRHRFAGYVAAQPLAWAGLLARKTYALLNDWEQYNNKTFAFHQARSPWLRWNPLSWGVLFVLGVAGFARLAVTVPRRAAALAFVAGATAASILFFYVSDRFRLPLAALLAVLAGGALAAPGFWRTWPRPRRLALVAILVLAAATTFSNFGGVRDRAPFVQDHALLARAAQTVGDDGTAFAEAIAALALQPAHPDALRIAVAAYFNQLLAGHAHPADEAGWLAASRQFLATPADDAPALRAVAALALWRAGDRPTALAEWRRLGANPAALAARLLAGDTTADERVQFAAQISSAPNEPLVRLATARAGLARQPGLADADSASLAALATSVFGDLSQPRAKP